MRLCITALHQLCQSFLESHNCTMLGVEAAEWEGASLRASC